MFNHKYLIIKSVNYQIPKKKKKKKKIFELQRNAHWSKNVTNKANASPV